MSTLLMRLAGPLQSWGDRSRFSRRETRTEPTKSGVLGLLAAADGRRRTDDIEDLVALRFGVRVDQEGRLVRDFQTAQRWESGDRMPLSYRYYLSDAIFLAGVEGDHQLLSGLAERLMEPKFPLYLGRRSCPPTLPLVLEISADSLEEALRTHPWQASRLHRKREASTVRLRLSIDAGEGVEGLSTETVRDVPVSYDPVRREYGWREVVTLDPVEMENPAGRDISRGSTDFYAAVVVSS